MAVFAGNACFCDLPASFRPGKLPPQRQRNCPVVSIFTTAKQILLLAIANIVNVIRALLEKKRCVFDKVFYFYETRSVHRDHLVRHLRLAIRGTEQTLEGFSRNISVAGIGIITDQAIASGATAKMEIERLKGDPVKIIAECRWCKSYGESWFISGWQFRGIKR